MNPVIVINLNGPAKSGKDALAQDILRSLPSSHYFGVHVEFKKLLVAVAIRSAGISRKLWDALYEREYKEVPQSFFVVNGKQVSARQWLIHTSETVMKPTFGEDVFGIALAKEIETIAASLEGSMPELQLVFVISDGGFVPESIPVVDLVAPANYHLFRIHRKDPETGEYLNFDGDSRNYIRAEDFPDGSQPRDYDIENVNGDITWTVNQIIGSMEKSYE